MPDREKVVTDLEALNSAIKRRVDDADDAYGFVDINLKYWQTVKEAIALLKEHEKATIEPKRIDIEDETKAWLDTLDAVDALGNIADICMDWDGYRTANGLGGLINEIWAYAKYCADRLHNAHEPRVMTLEEVKAAAGHDVWLELSGNIPDDVLFAANIEGCGTNGLYTRYESFNYSTYGIRPYGWRCWTSRPDEKRRAETPWE